MCITDFGLQNGFVGTMQGVLCGLVPGARWIDLTHGIPAQNLMVAAIELRAAWDFFPEGSLHLAVVDPGVGSGRRILCGARESSCFLGPDNGLLPEVLGQGQNLWQLDPAPWQLQGASQTFHGRDLFVPLAAALLRGDLDVENAVQVLDPVLLPPRPRPDPGALGPGVEISLSILMADRFGNLICDWDARELGLPVPGSKIRVRDHVILRHRARSRGARRRKNQRGG